MSIRASAPRNYGSRKVVDTFMRGLTIVATLIAVVPLVLIIGYVTVIGGSALSVDFFTKTYEPPATAFDAGFGADGTIPGVSDGTIPGVTDGAIPGVTDGAIPGVSDGTIPGVTDGAIPGVSDGLGEKGADLVTAQARGGVLHGIVGTFLVTGLALLISLPIGILAGVFLAEYPSNSVATAVRFCTDLLSGAPSIIAGVTAYILIVVQFRQFSGMAGAIALTFLMVPTIVRTTEEVLKLVPESTREAALAMGAPTWYSTFTVVIPTALSGIVTGVMLAFARGAGETAPLILTVLGSNVVSFDIFQPIAALPLITYRYTESPYPGENVQAWGTAFVLMMVVLVVNIAVRLATRSRLQGR